MKGKLSFMSRPRYGGVGGLLAARLHASGGTADGAARASRRNDLTQIAGGRITTPKDIRRFSLIVNTVWGILESVIKLT